MPQTLNEKATPSVRAGRPRRFEAADELRILLDAALVVMERNGYVDAAVADIFREADLSTRSFYRHFESKDQLLCALCPPRGGRRFSPADRQGGCSRRSAGGARRLDRRDPVFAHQRAKAVRVRS